MILARSGESAQAIGRFRDSRIAVTTCAWKCRGTCGSRHSAGFETAAEADEAAVVALDTKSRVDATTWKRRLRSLVLFGFPIPVVTGSRSLVGPDDPACHQARESRGDVFVMETLSEEGQIALHASGARLGSAGHRRVLQSG
jgi:hypothetical protein